MTTASTTPATGEPLLEAHELTRHFPTRGATHRRGGVVHALDGVSLTLRAGEVLGVVGESGCGKSTLARILALLDQPTSGDLTVLGRRTAGLSERELRRMRRDVQMVFQDPYTSLNPRLTVGSILREPFDVHGDLVPRAQRAAKVEELLVRVGLKPEFADRYPHQFSGGQRQRIGIARALALNPKIVICDEPVSALDVSVQAQIINLLGDLRRDLGIASVFVSHDLAVIRQVADRVAVMYLGQVVELGDADSVLSRARHPYSAALLSATPDPDTGAGRRRIILTGEVPTPVDPPTGCRFHPRCWKAEARCAAETPALVDRRGGGLVACHFPVIRPDVLEA